MMRSRQKQVEKFLVREFLEKNLGLNVIRLLGRNPGPNSHRPDIYAAIEKNGGKVVLEIELTEYQVDTQFANAGGSPGERLNSFWREVQESLWRRLSKRPVEVEVLVTLNDPSKVKKVEARGFAEELVRLAREFDFSASRTVSLTAFQPRFPLLAQYVRKLSLKKVGFYSCAWTCTNASAAMVGVIPRHVANLVRKKGNKNYTWAEKAEKWLLLCASGRSIVGHAGPPPNPVAWQDPELQAACKASPFDRVFFWDRVRGWHESLK
jgi:hypothetical protein